MKKTILICSIIVGCTLISKSQSLLAPNSGYSYVPNQHNKIQNKGTMIFKVADSTLPVKDAAYYLAKSKHQNSTAWVFASAGAVLIVAAIIVGSGKEKTNTTGSWNFGPSDKEVWTGILGGLGGGFLIASVPCFITAGVNKHKARVAISNEKTGYGIPGGGGDITGFVLSIPIGR